MCAKSQLAPDIMGIALDSAAVLVFNPSCHQYMHRASLVPCVHAHAVIVLFFVVAFLRPVWTWCPIFFLSHQPWMRFPL